MKKSGNGVEFPEMYFASGCSFADGVNTLRNLQPAKNYFLVENNFNIRTTETTADL